MATIKPHPLSDRSNSRSPSPPPSRFSHRIDALQHRTSQRLLFPNLDSSEGTPSEHSSICDGRVVQVVDNSETERPEPGGVNEPTQRQIEHGTGKAKEEKNQACVTVRFINNPHGTPLSTIIEQKSYATLKTQASLPNIKRNFTPIHVDLNSKYIPTESTPLHENRRAISFSLDELALHELRKRETACKDSSEVPTPALNHSEDVKYSQPVSPIYPPPIRAKTPPGKPRWPGDLPTSRSETQTVRRSVSQAFRRFFHSSGASQRNQTVFGMNIQPARRASMPVRTGRAYWAPPRSGHATSRFEQIEQHPFHNMPLAQPTVPAQEAILTPPLESGYVIAEPEAARRNLDERTILFDSTASPLSRLSLMAQSTLQYQTASSGGIQNASPRSCSDDYRDTHHRLSDLGTGRGIAEGHEMSWHRPPRYLMAPLHVNASSEDAAIGYALDRLAGQRSTRDDIDTRYIADGIPIYRPDAPSPLTGSDPSSRSGSLHTLHTAPSAGTGRSSTLSAFRMTMNTPRGIFVEPTPPLTSNTSLPVLQRTKAHTVTSAALPMLLPIAAAAGIIDEISLPPSALPTDGSPSDSGPLPADQAQTYACPHITATAREPPLAARLRPAVDFVGLRTYEQGKKMPRCWKCGTEDRVNRVGAWMLRRCFCQPDPLVDEDEGSVGEMAQVRRDLVARPVILNP